MATLPDNLSEIFEYLDDLRESGAINMFGAGPYVEQDFDLDEVTARAVLIAWQRTFSGGGAPEDRAALAQKNAAVSA